MTKEELRNYLDSCGVHTSNVEFDAIFRSMDYDGDGVITTHEFIAEFNVRGEISAEREEVARHPGLDCCRRGVVVWVERVE